MINNRKSRIGVIKVLAEEVKKEVTYSETVEPVKININATTDLVISVPKSSEGEVSLDIRTFINTERYKGATKKGININLENIEELISALEKVNAECEKLGL